jgi:hypothetical protein
LPIGESLPQGLDNHRRIVAEDVGVVALPEIEDAVPIFI